MKLNQWAQDITNKRFDRLIAIEPLYTEKHSIRWLCRCDCGNTTVVGVGSLNFGSVRSCGCLVKDSVRWNKKPIGEAALLKLFSRYKRQAKKRALEFSLSLDIFKELTSSICHYCKVDPNMSMIKYDSLNGDYLYNGIDRIDSEIGYTISNVVPCCGICNRAKGTLSYEEFLLWIKRLKLSV